MSARPDPGSLQVARLVDAGGDQHRVVARPQLGQGGVAPDLEPAGEDDPGLLEQPGAAQHHLLLQLEVRDPVDHQPAHPVVAVVDMDLVALSAQLLGRGEPGRAGADDADRLRPLAPGLRRLHPAALPGRVGDVFLDRADRHRAVAGLLDDAVAFAEPVLRADAAADLREVVGGRGDLVGLLQPALGGQLQPVGDVVLNRAMDLAERNAALRAARRLLGRLLGGELGEDLVEVGAPPLGVALLRHRAADGDETLHPGRHDLSPAARRPPSAPPDPHVIRRSPDPYERKSSSRLELLT